MALLDTISLPIASVAFLVTTGRICSVHCTFHALAVVILISGILFSHEIRNVV